MSMPYSSCHVVEYERPACGERVDSVSMSAVQAYEARRDTHAVDFVFCRFGSESQPWVAMHC